MTNQLATDHTTMRDYRIQGGGGAEIYVAETGNRAGRPVLFIHGFSQCRLAWSHQMQSDLRENLRLVVMDLRGHGLSADPDTYGDSALWADDIHAVITALGLEQPILCGWSYGGVVIGDYLRKYGEQAIGGIALIAAVTRLGEPVLPFMGADFLATLPGLFDNDVEVSATALEKFISITTYGDSPAEDFYLALGYNAIVAPRVRQALMSRTLNQDDLWAALALPTLVIHGLEDQVVLPSMSQHHAGLIPRATVLFYPETGHAPFSEDAHRFNEDLAAFASSL